MKEKSKFISPITNFDPVGNFLRQKLRITPVTFGLLIFVMNVIVDSWIGWQYDVFIKNPFPPAPPGILQDFMAITTDAVFMPIVCGLFLWAPGGTTTVFQHLLDAQILKNTDEYHQIINSQRSIYSNKWAFIGISFASIVFGIFQLGAYFNWFPWKTVGGYIDAVPQASYFRLPFWMIMFYTLAFVAFNVGVTIFTLRRLFKSAEIRILPLHPDKCGGLGAISKYTTTISIGVGTVGLLISAATIYEVLFGSLEKAIPVILGIIAYLILAPIFFFFPLGTAHDSMRKAKDEELLGIAQKYHLAYDNLKSSSEYSDAYEKEFKNLENIKMLYEVAEAFPVWPFDVHNLRRFLTIITTPVLPAIVSIFERMISQWL